MDVIGVGDAAIDIYLDVDHIPGRDEKVFAHPPQYYAGGMVANYLAALGKLGLSCGFHGPVGDDEFGRLTLADLQSHGVDTRHAIVRAGERTYFCVVLLDGSGEKALVIVPTACFFPYPQDISESAIAQARHIHTTAAHVPTTLKTFTIAKSHGLTTSLDLEQTMATQREVLQPLLPLIDILFINRAAACALGESLSIPDAARLIQTAGPGIVCVTLGAEGCLVASSEGLLRVGAFPVQVVDSTGAGDCFAAGFTFGYLHKWTLARTAAFASAVSALSLLGRGGHAHAPTYTDVTTFLDQNPASPSQRLES